MREEVLGNGGSIGTGGCGPEALYERKIKKKYASFIHF